MSFQYSLFRVLEDSSFTAIIVLFCINNPEKLSVPFGIFKPSATAEVKHSLGVSMIMSIHACY